MAEPESRGRGAHQTPAQPREQVDRQRDAEEGAGVSGRIQNPGPAGGPTGAERPDKGSAGPQGGAHDLPQPAGGHSSKTMSDPDVVLQIPQAKVEQIYVEVDDLDASVSLRARLGSLLQLDVGVQAQLGTVKIDIKGVEAEAMLEVRLEELRGILDSALRTIERNPQIIESLVKTVDTAVNQVGQTAQQVLGPQGPLSQTLQQTTQQVGQQLGQTTQQLAQNRAAAAGGGGLGGVLGGFPARTAWQRMKKVVNDSQQLRQVAARLVGPPGQQPQS
ncbi:hypothetical protein GCE86_14930 [Micromonospora terminaliae]|uniref:Uncharacterized protein n=1 Tax=Micromonospora terminaliae TaxID=1914461 RepID=A0AAJ3DID6_9ACTN|nr:hypothetical protein [Micromonospora terminaliae]NES27018.1 hypothetical protein [Micromonospora terminaliae]QGL48209.1 hypothetical protein GCE86_14930 [Micromonospora terminaliae]